jgi:acetyl esterase/lipase
MTKRSACCAILLIVAASAPRPSAQTSRVPTVDDLLKITSVGGAQIAPDGKTVAYKVYNTDITPFTINYLGDDPAEDPDMYSKTSPMTYVRKARTPTLIQHGELDRRVPIANAYELRQGLEDRGVKVEMVVSKGFGHGINKPRSMRAVMEHNLAWFNHYIFGDPLPDLANPMLPKKSS